MNALWQCNLGEIGNRTNKGELVIKGPQEALIVGPEDRTDRPSAKPRRMVCHDRRRGLQAVLPLRGGLPGPPTPG